MIGTDDRHLPLFFVRCICYYHVFPRDSAIWVSCLASLRWCMTPSTSRRWHYQRSNPILWIDTQIVKRQRQNRLAHFRERLKTAIIWHVKYSILSRSFCKPLICKCLYNTLRTKNRGSSLFVLNPFERCDKSWTLGREVVVTRLPRYPGESKLRLVVLLFLLIHSSCFHSI
jgi:hypothetical protein